MVNDLAAEPLPQLLAGVVLLLAGINHITQPSASLVAGVLNMLGVSGSAVGLVAQLAGVLVLAIGLGQTGMAAEDLGIY